VLVGSGGAGGHPHLSAGDGRLPYLKTGNVVGKILEAVLRIQIRADSDFSTGSRNLTI
jgi:hypothetical protein